MTIQKKRLQNIIKNSKYYKDFEIRNSGKTVVFKGDFDKYTAHLTSRGWILAEWCAINNNYRCTYHISYTPQGFCYCFARNLEGLAGDYTVKKFRSIYDVARTICFH